MCVLLSKPGPVGHKLIKALNLPIFPL